jgi:hypothetical protein
MSPVPTIRLPVVATIDTDCPFAETGTPMLLRLTETAAVVPPSKVRELTVSVPSDPLMESGAPLVEEKVKLLAVKLLDDPKLSENVLPEGSLPIVISPPGAESEPLFVKVPPVERRTEIDLPDSAPDMVALAVVNISGPPEVTKLVSELTLTVVPESENRLAVALRVAVPGLPAWDANESAPPAPPAEKVPVAAMVADNPPKACMLGACISRLPVMLMSAPPCPFSPTRTAVGLCKTTVDVVLLVAL